VEVEMVTKALFVRLEAKPGKESEVERFIRDGLPIVQDESGRQAHLSGRVATALKAKASELFAKPPSIEQVDVLAAKLPA
jgi:hypothetical protein